MYFLGEIDLFYFWHFLNIFGLFAKNSYLYDAKQELLSSELNNYFNGPV